MRPKVERMWINQPSTLQPHHKLHGTNVLAVLHPPESQNAVTVYFLEGDVISQQVCRIALSKGWKTRKGNK